eukprot:122637-Chlamydomonas_euryale.AAC.2
MERDASAADVVVGSFHDLVDAAADAASRAAPSSGYGCVLGRSAAGCALAVFWPLQGQGADATGAYTHAWAARVMRELADLPWPREATDHLSSVLQVAPRQQQQSARLACASAGGGGSMGAAGRVSGSGGGSLTLGGFGAVGSFRSRSATAAAAAAVGGAGAGELGPPRCDMCPTSPMEGSTPRSLMRASSAVLSRLIALSAARRRRQTYGGGVAQLRGDAGVSGDVDAGDTCAPTLVRRASLRAELCGGGGDDGRNSNDCGGGGGGGSRTPPSFSRASTGGGCCAAAAADYHSPSSSPLLLLAPLGRRSGLAHAAGGGMTSPTAWRSIPEDGVDPGGGGGGSGGAAAAAADSVDPGVGALRDTGSPMVSRQVSWCTLPIPFRRSRPGVPPVLGAAAAAAEAAAGTGSS